MVHSGMVHALEEIHRLMKPDGMLINIHPVSEGYFIKVIQGDRTLFAERKRDTCSEDVIRAEEAIAQIIERSIFAIDQDTEFDFLTYASSVPELRAYWEEQNAFDDRLDDEAVVEREENLYAQVEEIMQRSGESTQIAIHEKVRIMRLKPLRR